MKMIKWFLATFLGLVLILVTFVIIDISPFYPLLTADDPSPQAFQTPPGVSIDLRSDIVFLTASEMAHKIREKELTAVEVVEAHLSQIYAFNPQVNAVVTIDAEGALKRAKEADLSLNQGKLWGPLHGVPFTVKDHLATKSIRTTSGFGPLKDVVPDYDATVVARLKEAGAILLGKTNLPTLGTCCGTTNLIFGTTNNPWDLSRTVGGSSGGSAAALATGMTPIEVGSDIGGSIRIPAHYYGIFGMKPTEHLISFHGGLAPGIEKLIPKMQEVQTTRHLIHLGPMARSIEDLQLLLEILTGPDPNDVSTVDMPLVFPNRKPHHQLRIAWTKNLPVNHWGQRTDKISLSSSKVIKNFIQKLIEEKITVQEKKFTPEYIQKAWGVFDELASMEYDFYFPVLFRIQAKLLGNPFSVVPYSYEKYQYILTERDQIISIMEKVFENYDALLLPVTLGSAYKHVEPKYENGMLLNFMEPVKIDGEIIENIAVDTFYTNLFNLMGNPVIVIPIGFTESGLPVGIQVVGRRWSDAKLLIVAKQLFEVAGDFRHPPGFMN